MVPKGTEYEAVAQVVQSMAAEAGFDLKLRVVEFATTFKQAQAGEFQVFQINWSGRIDPDGKTATTSAGCTMDSIIHLEVFLCLPLADGIPMPTGKARFDAHKAQYDTLNKIYGTYFSPGKAPSRACMALEWIPGDSLIEIVGSAAVLTPPTAG